MVQTVVSELIVVSLKGAVVLAVGASVLYVATIVAGAFLGAALPAATIFHVFPPSLVLLEFERPLSSILVCAALVGASLHGSGRAGALNFQAIKDAESWITKVLCRWGIVLIFVCLMVSINAGGWSGKVDIHSLSWASFLNLMPMSDANAYMASSWDRAINGRWDMVAANRPLAQAMRDLTFLLSGYSYPNMLLLQAVLVTVGVGLVAGRITRYWGIWSAIAFVGLMTGMTRTLLPSAMTEPLALAFALGGFAYYLDALEQRSVMHAIVALAAITMALMMRMGVMFVVPFLVAWTAYTFGDSQRSRLKLAALFGFACLSVFAVSALVGRLYAAPEGALGANFAMTLCGLSVGGSWGDCYLKLYAGEVAGLPTHSSAVASIMLQKAAENIVAAPTVFLLSLIRNILSYLAELPRHVLPALSAPPGLLNSILLVLLGLALAANLWHAGRRKAIFWIGLVLSVLASAAFVYADGSQRVMEVGSAMLAVIFSVAFANSKGAPQGRVLDWKIGAAGVSMALLLAMAAPGALHAWTHRSLLAHLPAFEPSEGEVVVAGGRTVAGFLVVPDGTERSLQAPSFFVSDFRRAADWLGIQRDYGLDISSLEAPFALVATMQLTPSAGYFITSPEILTRPDVRSWRLTPRYNGWRPFRTMDARPLKN